MLFIFIWLRCLQLLESSPSGVYASGIIIMIIDFLTQESSFRSSNVPLSTRLDWAVSLCEDGLLVSEPEMP